MTKSLVGLVRQDGYDFEEVLKSLDKCLAPLGGMKSVVQPGQTVLLKPNVLGPYTPNRAINTHPSVLKAAIILAQRAGARVIVGDSPGVGSFRLSAKTAGLIQVIEETGAEVADFSNGEEYEVPGYKVVPHLTLAKALRTADVLITLPKLKTHAQMSFTGALKNQYGLIPGTLKSQWHFRLQTPEWLAALIVDLHKLVKPSLAIMDGIVGMEGDGPSGGKPRKLGILMASHDLVALDAMACHLIGLDPRQVPILAEAFQRGLGTASLDNVEVVGTPWKELAQPKFEKVHAIYSPLRVLPLPRPMLDWIRFQWTMRPRILAERCIECNICSEGCPVKPSAIFPGRPGPLSVDDMRCIHCYCCHEFCPEQAIKLQRSFLARVFGRIFA